MLDLRRLRVLHAVSRHGSLTAAAAALGYSSSAVSQQISALERDIGMPLTERSGRRIALTPAADILVAHTDVLLGQLELAESDVASLRDSITGTVRIAAFPSAAANIVPTAWSTLTHTTPHLQLELHEMEPDESLPALLAANIDIAIAHEYDLVRRPLDSQYEQRELMTDPVLIAVASDGAFSSGQTLGLSSLSDQPFLAPHARTSCAEMTTRACADAGFVPRITARATDFNVLLNLVGAGLGVALVPALAAQRPPANVRLVSPAVPITRRIFTASRRGGDRKPAVRVALDALTQATNEAMLAV
jgi:DNA-binding transcriptional LysR family regulator